ncbi:MAG: WcaF family extracellular polysaccharide biosynthesis acetyltransferase [Chthoniobacterales bacterium]
MFLLPPSYFSLSTCYLLNLATFDNSDFDRGAPTWKEALWTLVRALFFHTALPWPSGLRVALLRAFGATIGGGVVIREHVNISMPWRLVIGDHAWIGEDVGILSLAQVTIGSNVCISQRAYLCTGSHDYRRQDFKLITRQITIEDGAWIAAAAFVAPGVTVGAGAVVTAGSVVVADVPPNTVVRGNPAEVVRTRNAESLKS